tara:strand:+ start:16007 stop:16561 length:555 start_codon:yes stop_codon:yes gene_type:complete
MKDTNITFKYIITALLAVFGTWIIHEFAHWAMAELLGYESTMRLNSTNFVKGQEVRGWHRQLVSAAGPIITMIQVVIVFLLLKKNWSKSLYLLLFVGFYMRLLASIMNAVNPSSPNDEGRISEYFGIGLYTIPILVSVFLFYLVFKISKQYHIPKKFQIVTYLIATLFIALLILSDQYFKIRII